MTTDTTKTNRPRPGRVILMLLAVVILLWLGWSGWQVLAHLPRLQANVSALQALSDPAALSALQPADLVALRDRVTQLDDDVQALAGVARPFVLVASAMGWVPKLGPEISQAGPLLDLGTNTSSAVRLALDGLAPALQAWQDKGGPGGLTERLVPALEGGAAQFAAAGKALQTAAAARARVDTRGFSARSQNLVGRFDTLLPLMQTLVQGAQVAPRLLGSDGPRTYLLLAQNNDELRATGGFISGVGLLRLNAGKIEATMQDSYSVDDWTNPHPDAPDALLKTMKAEVLALRDANWWPDFPTSARTIQTLYQTDRHVATDGVIAFDLTFVQNLVAALEPLQLPGYQNPIDGNTIIPAMHTVWAQPADTTSTVNGDIQGNDWWTHRKDFMGDLMKATLSKAQGGDVRPGPLLYAFKNALDGGHLLVSVDDPALASLLSQSGWSGRVDPGPGDFLMVVDSNVGWNKVNPRIEQSILYAVNLDAQGGVQASVTIDYRHTSQVRLTACVHEARYGDSYEDMMDRCYFDYVRLLVPAGTRLIGSEGLEAGSEASEPGDGGTQSFGGYFVLPPAATHRVRFVYDLPQSVLSDGLYRLEIQKQAGTRPWPLIVTVATPPAWQVTPLTAGASVQAGRLTWQTMLDRDRALLIRVGRGQ